MKKPKRGYCACGCGQKTTRSPHDWAGYKKGEPRKWIQGHETKHFFRTHPDLNLPRPIELLDCSEVRELRDNGKYKPPHVRNLIATILDNPIEGER